MFLLIVNILMIYKKEQYRYKRELFVESPDYENELIG